MDYDDYLCMDQNKYDLRNNTKKNRNSLEKLQFDMVNRLKSINGSLRTKQKILGHSSISKYS